jgi:hypothetical protein
MLLIAGSDDEEALKAMLHFAAEGAQLRAVHLGNRLDLARRRMGALATGPRAPAI